MEERHYPHHNQPHPMFPSPTVLPAEVSTARAAGITLVTRVLGSTAERLAEAVGELESRIRPILIDMPAPPEMAPDSHRALEGVRPCPAAEKLEDVARFLNAQIDYMRLVMSRVDC